MPVDSSCPGLFCPACMELLKLVKSPDELVYPRHAWITILQDILGETGRFPNSAGTEPKGTL